MDLMSYLLCLLVAWTSIYIIVSARRSKSSAGNWELGELFSCTKDVQTSGPGTPVPFPIVGNLLNLGNKPHQSLANLAKIYGRVMSLKLGCVTTVVITSATMVKEVLQKKDQTLQKICNSHIFTNQKLDSSTYLRHQKVQDLLANVEQSYQAGDVVDIGQEAFRTTLNLLSNTTFSMDLVEPSSDTVQEFKELVRHMMEEAAKPNLVDYFPVVRKIDPQGIRRRMAIHFGKMIEVLDKKGWMASSDVLDTLLNISEDNNNVLDITHIDHLEICEICVYAELQDLFVAGTNTTANTLEWAMTELLHIPVLGKDKLVKESDIARLPYLQVVVKETFRLHPAVPFLLPRKVEVDTEICGFIVPKDAQVLVNVWAIGRDPNLWENPNLFMPERFLGSDMDVRDQNFELISFSAGRRICPGLLLGIRMVQLMLASLIHSYDWKLEDGMTPENMNVEEKVGVTLPKAQPLRVLPIHV
ncbi:hypothetical protein PVL29_002329 [Vitis rotundifolia]|uniref:Uncharacterized protein n=1 Tax=Vitis rotundifolia TaxID=103349 RepID=A0AA39AGT0_VITRO|nr:hypothetical protein PVL29_002329 [Vitis rotundifolia]